MLPSRSFRAPSTILRSVSRFSPRRLLRAPSTVLRTGDRFAPRLDRFALKGNFGFIEFENRKEAKVAMLHIHGMKFGGERLGVDVSCRTQSKTAICQEPAV